MSIAKGLSTSMRRANVWGGLFLPYLVAATALAVAAIGAVLVRGDGGVDGVNGFVENLSGRSGSFLGELGLPLAFAFGAGMVATVNPCGFAMLPAYLGLYLGSNEYGADHAHSIQRLARALLVGGVVTAGFVVLFGIAGLVIGAGARFVVHIIPWMGLAIGMLLAIAGSWLLSGGKLYFGFAGRAAAHMGNPGQVSVRGYFLFGLSYATASLSCTLPIFLVVVVSTLAVSGVLAAIGQFVLYALGMGLVIMVLTVGMTLFQGTMVGALRKTLRYIQPISAGLMILAGSYIVFYWLTIGDLGKRIENLF